MIDRSKPLPIHEFPNLIDEVARLKELEGRRRAIIERQHETGNPNHALLERLGIERDMLNDAPKLLNVLGDIRAGDANALEEIADILEEAGFVAKAAYVRRYCGMAKKMEANR